MRFVFASLVASSLLIHAVLGCCWHAGRERATSEFNVACSHHAHGDCCDHHADHDGDADHGDSHGPCDGKSHCHGLCTYLPVQKAQVDTQQLDLPMDFAAILPATCDAQLAGSSKFLLLREPAAEPPLRLHLLHQILLI